MGGAGYAPYGEVYRDRGGSVAGAEREVIDGALRVELQRALAVTDCANNAV